MQSSIAVALHRSRLLDVLLIVIHAIAAICVMQIPLAGVFRIVLLGFVLLSLWRALRRQAFSHLLLSSKNVSRLCLTGENSQSIDARILPETVVFPFLISLHLRNEKDRRLFHTLLLPDQMGVEEYRRVRVWLRWKITDGAKHCA